MINQLVPTNLNTTINLPGVTRQTSKLIHQNLRWNRTYLVLICSNVLTVKGIIKLTQTHIHFGSITSTECQE